MPVSEAKRRNNDKYNAKCDAIMLRPIKAQGEQIRAAAAAAGMSLQGWILSACSEKLQRDGYN